MLMCGWIIITIESNTASGNKEISTKDYNTASENYASMVKYRSPDQWVSGFESRFRSEEHTSELQSRENLVCRLLLEKKKHPIERQRRPLPTQPYTGCE